MAKFYGKIGFAKTVETAGGVWKEEIVEKQYPGDLLEYNQKYVKSDSLNDNINISNKISIIADSYATENFQYMKYIEFMGALWKISNVGVQYPRLILTTGGVYNGPQT